MPLKNSVLGEKSQNNNTQKQLCSIISTNIHTESESCKKWDLTFLKTLLYKDRCWNPQRIKQAVRIVWLLTLRQIPSKWESSIYLLNLLFLWFRCLHHSSFSSVLIASPQVLTKLSVFTTGIFWKALHL